MPIIAVVPMDDFEVVYRACNQWLSVAKIIQRHHHRHCHQMRRRRLSHAYTSKSPPMSWMICKDCSPKPKVKIDTIVASSQ